MQIRLPTDVERRILLAAVAALHRPHSLGSVRLDTLDFEPTDPDPLGPYLTLGRVGPRFDPASSGFQMPFAPVVVRQCRLANEAAPLFEPFAVRCYVEVPTLQQLDEIHQMLRHPPAR